MACDLCVGEADIEEILRSYAHQESLKTSVTITNCSQPSPRANCSMAAMGTNNSDFLLFGGEFCDGEKTEVLT